MLSIDVSVTRAPVELVWSGFEPSNVIDTIRPLDNLTVIVVLTAADTLFQLFTEVALD